MHNCFELMERVGWSVLKDYIKTPCTFWENCCEQARVGELMMIRRLFPLFFYLPIPEGSKAMICGAHMLVKWLHSHLGRYACIFFSVVVAEV